MSSQPSTSSQSQSHPRQHGNPSLSNSSGPKTSSSSSLPASSHHHSHNYHHLSHEERLGKVWRHLASSIVSFIGKAEKAGTDSTQANCKELDESVLAFLRTRMEWHRLMSHVEAKLQGKAQEMEALECYVRTQPRLGKRKRGEEASTVNELQTAMQKVSDQPTPTPTPS